MVFHLFFEDESHSLLGNLIGNIIITEINGKARGNCELFLSHESVDKIELVTSFMPFFFYDGAQPILIATPPISKITLHHNEQGVIADNLRDMSKFEEPKVIFGFLAGTIEMRGGDFTIPTIKLYFFNGRT